MVKSDLMESLEQIIKIATTMRDDKDMSEKSRGQADRILGIAEQQLAAMGEAGKPVEGGE